MVAAEQPASTAAATTAAETTKPNNNVLVDVMLTCGRLVLSLLGCDSFARGSQIPGLKRERSPLAIYTDLGEELIAKQVYFRRARIEAYRRQQRRKLSIVAEASFREEHRMEVDLEKAAIIVLQTYVRMLKSDKQSKPPVYRRHTWVGPTEKESSERLGHLQDRFPEMSPNTLRKHLEAFNGHAGYAAAALLSGGRQAKYEVMQVGTVGGTV